MCVWHVFYMELSTDTPKNKQTNKWLKRDMKKGNNRNVLKNL